MGVLNLILALVFDIDGSIMPQGGPIDQRVAMLLCKLRAVGLKIGPATGKNADYCRGMACGCSTVFDYVIAETGAQFLELIAESPPAYRQRKLMGVDSDLTQFLRIIDYRQFGRTFRFRDREENFRPELKEGIISFFPADAETRATEQWEIYFNEIVKTFRLGLNVHRHSDGCVDVVPSAVSKALGIRHVCDMLSIERANIVTVVDGVNDLELTQGGVFPIAVGNAREEIKKAVVDAGGFVATAKYGDGFIEGLRHYAEEGRFEKRVANVILA